MKSERTPDAVRSPLPHAGVGDSSERLARLQAEFSRVLRLAQVFVRHQGIEHFVSGSRDDTINFPSHDLRAGRPRYDWEDRGDGVLYGYLKPEA